MRSLFAFGVLFALALTASPGKAFAENPEGPDYQIGGSQIDLHRRYPGDRPLQGGNVRSEGPEQGAYVERCTWHARETFLGLPWGFSQRCRRHTLENTQ